jgi:hypothetical protein
MCTTGAPGRLLSMNGHWGWLGLVLVPAITTTSVAQPRRPTLAGCWEITSGREALSPATGGGYGTLAPTIALTDSLLFAREGDPTYAARVLAPGVFAEDRAQRRLVGTWHPHADSVFANVQSRRDNAGVALRLRILPDSLDGMARPYTRGARWKSDVAVSARRVNCESVGSAGRVAIVTCCAATEDLARRYRSTAPEDRPPELAFLGANGFAGALRAVVKDTVMWARLWSGMHHGIFQARAPGQTQVPYEPPLPHVDFAREMLIVVGTGERPSTGYSLRIDSVRLGRASGEARELRVYVTEWRPGRSCGVGWAITSPVALARLRRLERLDVAVHFIERTRYMSCE